MRNYYFVLIFFIIASCSSSKQVYWCGDHPCINKKEKISYFKETMIVEIKELDKKKIRKNSEIEKITQQARLDEKKRIKGKKDLAKQVRLDEKKRIKEEKDLAKQVRLDEKKRIKEEKDLAKKKIAINKKNTKQKKVIRDANITKIDVSSNNVFKEIIEKITKKNMFRPYPNINDIPN